MLFREQDFLELLTDGAAVLIVLIPLTGFARIPPPFSSLLTSHPESSCTREVQGASGRGGGGRVHIAGTCKVEIFDICEGCTWLAVFLAILKMAAYIIAIMVPGNTKVIKVAKIT